MTHVGADFSAYQGELPETGLEFLSFAFVKLTEGTDYKNPDAPQQAGALLRQGVKVGWYHFVTMDPIADQSFNFYRMIKAMPPTKLPYALDCETTDPSGWVAEASVLMAFAMKVEQWSPNRTLFYANLDFAHNLAGFPWGRPVWLADPNPGAPHFPCLILQGAPRPMAPLGGLVDPDTFIGSDAQWDAFVGNPPGTTGTSAPSEPPQAPQPPIGPQEPPMPLSQALSYRSGQYDAFQVNNGSRLLHHFHAGLGWATEDLGEVAGLGGLCPPFVGTPQGAVVGGVCIVTVEDNAGNAWFFFQGATGNWEASKQ